MTGNYVRRSRRHHDAVGLLMLHWLHAVARNNELACTHAVQSINCHNLGEIFIREDETTRRRHSTTDLTVALFKIDHVNIYSQ